MKPREQFRRKLIDSDTYFEGDQLDTAVEIFNEIYGGCLSKFEEIVGEMTLMEDRDAKKIILTHCSPETTARDISISDIEEDLMANQLHHSQQEILEKINEL